MAHEQDDSLLQNIKKTYPGLSEASADLSSFFKDCGKKGDHTRKKQRNMGDEIIKP